MRGDAFKITTLGLVSLVISACFHDQAPKVKVVENQVPGPEQLFPVLVNNDTTNDIGSYFSMRLLNSRREGERQHIEIATSESAQIKPIKTYWQGVYQPFSASVTDVKRGQLLYSHRNESNSRQPSVEGKLYAVNLEVEDKSNPQVRQISSETQAHQICSGWNNVGTNYVYSFGSRYIYRRTADSANCTNAPWFMVRLDMSANEAPQALPFFQEFIQPIRNPNSGDIYGWLVRESNQLVTYDLEFSAGSRALVTNSATNIVSVEDWLRTSDERGILLLTLKISETVFENQIVRFDADTNAVTILFATTTNQSVSSLAYWRSCAYTNHAIQENQLHFVVSEPGSQSIYRLDVSSNAQNSQLLLSENVNDSTDEGIRGLWLTSSSLLYAMGSIYEGRPTGEDHPNWHFSRLRTLDTRGSGAPFDLLTLPQNNEISCVVVSPQKVFVSKKRLDVVTENNPGGTPYQRSVWSNREVQVFNELNSGTPEMIFDAEIRGVIYGNRFDFKLVNIATPKQLIVQSGFIADLNRKLVVVAADSGQVQRELGRISTRVSEQENSVNFFASYGYPSGTISMMMKKFRRDVFYYDANHTNSLRRMTFTPDVDEVVW
ncbi:MAG: hypothetical protein OEY38_18220 [Gammaproteobacteria bacterium]|nr:hypothetical protein [Gammaproteobacteria bacterium]